MFHWIWLSDPSWSWSTGQLSTFNFQLSTFNCVLLILCSWTCTVSFMWWATRPHWPHCHMIALPHQLQDHRPCHIHPCLEERVTSECLQRLQKLFGDTMFDLDAALSASPRIMKDSRLQTPDQGPWSHVPIKQCALHFGFGSPCSLVSGHCFSETMVNCKW